MKNLRVNDDGKKMTCFDMTVFRLSHVGEMSPNLVWRSRTAKSVLTTPNLVCVFVGFFITKNEQITEIGIRDQTDLVDTPLGCS